MQWTFNREMQEYESDTRGPFYGVIRVIGPWFYAGIRTAATGILEDGPRFADQAEAQAWIEGELVERVPLVPIGPSISIPLPRGERPSSLMSSVPLYREPHPCPMCGTFFLPEQMEGHIQTAHPERFGRAILPVIRPQRERRTRVRRPPSIRCTLCQNPVSRTRYVRHVRRIHLLGKDSRLWTDMITCVFCPTTLMLGDYPRHLEEQHPHELVSAARG